MDVLHFISSLDGEWRLGIAYVVGGAVLLITLLSQRPTIKRSHEWRIKSAARALDVLHRIGVNRGPAAQFAYIRKLDPMTWEECLLTSIEREGHRIRRNERYTGDGGVDGECEIDGIRIFLQAKRYHGHIDRAHVADFVVRCTEARRFGIFAHSGITGSGSRSLGDGVVEIVSGEKLLVCLGVHGDRANPTPWRTIVHRASRAGWQS